MRTFTFLGTGTSTGVPCLGCDCEVCRSTDPRNQRMRPSALVATPAGNILIDTPPELRIELLRADVSRVHAVLYTHYHADHLYGMDDLRQFPRYLGGAVPVYCAEDVERVIRRTFPYIFPGDPEYSATNYVAKIEFHRLQGGQRVTVLDQMVLPIPLVHAQFKVFGYRIDGVAYCTDLNRVPEPSMGFLQGLKVLIVDALRYRPHPAHLGLNEALELITQLKPERAYLTHVSHDLDYETVSKLLPPNVTLAYDGLSFEF